MRTRFRWTSKSAHRCRLPVFAATDWTQVHNKRLMRYEVERRERSRWAHKDVIHTQRDM